MLYFLFSSFYQDIQLYIFSIWLLFWTFISFVNPHNLLYALNNIFWTLHHSHSFLSSILTLYHHFLILLVTVVLIGIVVILEPLVKMKFYTHLRILDTILQLVLMGFVVLNGWYPIMAYLPVWLDLFLLLVNNNDSSFLPLFFHMSDIRL